LNYQRKDEILTLEEVINIFASFDLAGGMHKHEEQILKLELLHFLLKKSLTQWKPLNVITINFIS
jgi:hypothetical protein